MKEVFTKNAPKPLGHYSQAIVHNNMVFVSGQLPINPDSPDKKIGPVEEQAGQVLHNISEILKASGSSINNVVKVTIYVSDVKLWDRINETYTKFFKEHKPARAVIPTKELHFGYNVLMDAIAFTND